MLHHDGFGQMARPMALLKRAVLKGHTQEVAFRLSEVFEPLPLADLPSLLSSVPRFGRGRVIVDNPVSRLNAMLLAADFDSRARLGCAFGMVSPARLILATIIPFPGVMTLSFRAPSGKVLTEEGSSILYQFNQHQLRIIKDWNEILSMVLNMTWENETQVSGQRSECSG